IAAADTSRITTAQSTSANHNFFLNDQATTDDDTLSLHDALPISHGHAPHPAPRIPDEPGRAARVLLRARRLRSLADGWRSLDRRSEEHTSELQSRGHLVCRLLLEKKKWHAWCGVRSSSEHILLVY